MSSLDNLFELSPDPEMAALRMENLLQQDNLRKQIEAMSDERLSGFVHLISISNFLYHFLFREADSITGLDKGLLHETVNPEKITDARTLRLFKYLKLFEITWQDIHGGIAYSEILKSLSLLADNIINKALELVVNEHKKTTEATGTIPFCILAMGKLGANELNYSSDVDLIFVCANEKDVYGDIHDYQKKVVSYIRKISNLLEETTEDGFLYRVDLRLRPLGRSGPLILSVDNTEQYYEASTEAWERFAWLRARVLAGNRSLGLDLLERLQPFIFHQTLSSDDLQRFLKIKNDMASARLKTDYWNVKLGEGGIRDIEFFIQVLQIVNAYQHPELKSTNTLSVLTGLVNADFLSQAEGEEIRKSYLFLRRLENRLQIIDERQTHELPDNDKDRVKIARSLGHIYHDSDDILEKFNQELSQHRKIAKSCFERILPRGDDFNAD